jgi:hypothetical protein
LFDGGGDGVLIIRVRYDAESRLSDEIAHGAIGEDAEDRAAEAKVLERLSSDAVVSASHDLG